MVHRLLITLWSLKHSMNEEDIVTALQELQEVLSLSWGRVMSVLLGKRPSEAGQEAWFGQC